MGLPLLVIACTSKAGVCRLLAASDRILEAGRAGNADLREDHRANSGNSVNSIPKSEWMGMGMVVFFSSSSMGFVMQEWVVFFHGSFLSLAAGGPEKGCQVRVSSSDCKRSRSCLVRKCNFPRSTDQTG